MSAIDSILTTEQYQTLSRPTPFIKMAMTATCSGRDAFLQLFTAQLKNQNPLDPMENEAFVAQLAQFSSVEGIKGMQPLLRPSWVICVSSRCLLARLWLASALP